MQTGHVGLQPLAPTVTAGGGGDHKVPRLHERGGQRVAPVERSRAHAQPPAGVVRAVGVEDGVEARQVLGQVGEHHTPRAAHPARKARQPAARAELDDGGATHRDLERRRSEATREQVARRPHLSGRSARHDLAVPCAVRSFRHRDAALVRQRQVAAPHHHAGVARLRIAVAKAPRHRQPAAAVCGSGAICRRLRRRLCRHLVEHPEHACAAADIVRDGAQLPGRGTDAERDLRQPTLLGLDRHLERAEHAARRGHRP
eukprot:scaffold44848_cov66-Phaeocystis_antarctica.AAC.2